MKSFVVYTDGASSGNPGPGGWGAVIGTPTGHVEELGGREKQTTNNRMELLAAIRGLEWLKRGGGETPHVIVFTDSTYVIRGITQWIWGWRKKGWVSAEGKEVANVDLWKVLGHLVALQKVEWKYVRGHTGVPGNERADAIAVGFSKGKLPALYSGPLLGYDFALFDFPEESDLPSLKSISSSYSRKPYSYLSLVRGVPKRHETWKECEGRVKGQSGARFQKVMNADEELQVLSSWGFVLKDLKD